MHSAQMHNAQMHNVTRDLQTSAPIMLTIAQVAEMIGARVASPLSTQGSITYTQAPVDPIDHVNPVDPDCADGVDTLEVSASVPQCMNPVCLYTVGVTHLHDFEITDDEHIYICSRCYDEGYRHCIISHEIHHISRMDQVLDDMYAVPAYNAGQLAPERLVCEEHLYDYFKSLGIANPSPFHSILDVAHATSNVEPQSAPKVD
jgi:hypothetical protein